MLKALLGVATFCRVKSAFSSSEVALPVAAEEGFTRFVDWSKRRKGLQEFAKDGLVKVDEEEHARAGRRVQECDILTEYKRWKLGDTSRWKGGWGIRLEGSDHAPVYTSLEEIHDIPTHSTLPLSARYHLPMIHGVQQTLGRLLHDFNPAGYQVHLQMEMLLYGFRWCLFENRREFTDENQDRPNTTVILQSQHTKLVPAEGTQKKARKSRCFQLSLRSFFQKSPNLSTVAENSSTKTSPRQAEPNSRNHSSDSHAMDDKSSSPNYFKVNSRTASQDQDERNDGLLERQKNSVLCWSGRRYSNSCRIVFLFAMVTTHKEPCVARIVKKPGPTLGRRVWQIVFDLSGDAPFHFKFFWSCGDLHPIVKQIEATSNGLLPNPGTNDCL
ncbi:hypothetical protein H0E87_010387 [Populus deltoides]|uniref:Uncharacterized protein n=1 Tax=Populus deltoides TaxID=3696 RepID=A0A8T2YSX4_POPDE|nr:hypothetical protein H0E87_010387 [Populus deltoides]